MSELCYCRNRQVVVERMAWTEANAGRRFMGCANGGNGCNYFRWIKEPMNNRSNSTITGLLRRMKRIEEENLLEMQAMEEMHIEEMKRVKTQAKKMEMSLYNAGGVFCFIDLEVI